MVNNERLYAIAKEKWPCSNMSCHSILHSVVDAVAAAVRAECDRDAKRWRTLQRLRKKDVIDVLSKGPVALRYCIPDVHNTVSDLVDAAIDKQEPKT